MPTTREFAGANALKTVYVYEAPVRIWHWINALAITVLAVTGYFIGSPMPTQPGEASANFLMGYIRFAHFAAGYVLAVGLLGRAYWAIVGNHHARELFWVPLFSATYWRDIGVMLKWYAFLTPRPGRFVGHNPLARFAMVFGFLLLAIFMVVTGFALYAEGAQMGSWQDKSVRLGDPAVRPVAGRAHLAPPGHVGPGDICHPAHLRRGARGHHGPHQPDQHHGLGPPHVQGLTWTPAPDHRVVLGIGNVGNLWADEGFGVRCIETLQQRYEFAPHVRLVDGGTQGLYLIQHVQAATHLLIFDAIDYGLEPGTLKTVENDEVPRFMGAKKMSLHQTGFQEVLMPGRC